MIGILKNNWVRLLAKREYIIISLVLTAGAIFLGIYFNQHISETTRIALINKSGIEVVEDASYIKVKNLKEQPAYSTLLLGKYDAVVTIDKDNHITVKTIKGDSFKNMVMSIFENKNFDYKPEAHRGLGANILGFLTMFLLLQGILYMHLYADDREEKQIIRIATSSTSFMKYLLAHFIFVFGFTVIPSVVLLIIAKYVCSLKIGFGILQYISLLSLIGIFSTAFSLFLNSFFTVADTANMLGSSIIILTSMISGCFSTIENNNSIFRCIVKLIPQNSFLGFAEAWEKNSISMSHFIKLMYIVVLSILLFGIAIYRNRKDYIAKMD